MELAPDETTTCDESKEGRQAVDAFEQQREWETRALRAQARAAQAYLRLVELAEQQTTGQAARIARFLASTYNGALYPLDLFELRALDVALADDALACIDALRWGKADLHKLLPGGEQRVAAVIASWGLERSEDPPEP
ncbi:MAG TPA: hypothetical protein PKJ45_14525 [Rubrivivax sp.]|nr:hypothetical protein [Rubrivivax sp.]